MYKAGFADKLVKFKNKLSERQLSLGSLQKNYVSAFMYNKKGE